MKEEAALETLQRLFSNAYIGLKNQQWKPSYNLDLKSSNKCLYFNAELNLKCAIGQSIPSDLYTEDFEGLSIPTNFRYYKPEQRSIILKFAQALRMDSNDEILVKQLQDLQAIHDKYVTQRFIGEGNSMKLDLEIYAEKHSLQIPTDDYVISY